MLWSRSALLAFLSSILVGCAGGADPVVGSDASDAGTAPLSPSGDGGDASDNGLDAAAASNWVLCYGACVPAAGEVLHCEGRCTGACNGECVADSPSGPETTKVSGTQCEGTCRGECSAKCVGNVAEPVKCDGQCKAEYEPMPAPHW
jgi:hypothetical protein